MPFPKPLARIRLWIGLLSVIVVLGIYLYFHYHEISDEFETPSSLPVFRWIPVHNLTHLEHCRNSKQGHSLIVDELGYVCPLSDVLPSDCCKAEGSNSVRYQCSTCNDDGCCTVYEHCVSCCLHPDKQPLLRSILSRSMEAFHPLYSSLHDQFELCLAKCRTSSQSVQHENTYRDPKSKYCYGTDTPTLLPEPNNNNNNIRQEDD